MQAHLQTWLLDEYFFSNTYPLFLKLMNMKCQGEALSDSVNRALVEAGVNLGEFYELDYRSARKKFNGARNVCYNYLCKEIKRIFQSGARLVLEETPDKMLCLYEVSHNGYCYTFVVDHRSDKKAVILTDFYLPWERDKEDLLMTSVNGKPFVENNTVNYRKYLGGRYYIINTYNVFCGYAQHLGKNINLGFNDILFRDVVNELDKSRLMNQGRISTVLNGKFDFLVYKNVIIVYQFKERSNYAACVVKNITKA